MARTGVTFLDISSAAEALRQRNLEPTVDRVREHLGTGSKSTIAPLLKRWREQHGEAAESSGMPGDLVAAVRALHERVQQSADARIEEARAEFKAAADALRQQLAERDAALQASQASESRLQSQVKALTEEVLAFRKDLDETSLRAAKAESQRDDARSRVEDLITALAEQKRESRTTQERFEHYQQQMAEDRQRERDEHRVATLNYQGQIQQLMDQLGKVEARYAELQDECRSQHQALEAQRAEFHALRERHAKAQADAEALARRLEDANATRDTWQRQAEAAEGRTATLAAELAAAQAGTRHLQQQLDQTGKAIASANDKIEHLQDENRLLGQEKSVLEGRLKQLQQGL